MNFNKYAVLSAALVASVVMTGCGSGVSVKPKPDKSVSGTVTEREPEGNGYELDVVDRKGKEHEIKVTYSVYKNCALFSHYPSCKSVKPKLNSPKVNKTPKAPKKEKKFSFGTNKGKKSGKK